VKAAGATSAPPLGGHWGMFSKREGVTFKEGEKDPVVLTVVGVARLLRSHGNHTAGRAGNRCA